jgi:hypothetical protein
METEHEIDGAESSSQPARTQSLGPIPSQLDAEQAAAQAGQLDATQRPAVRKDDARAAALAGSSPRQATATGEGLRSASRALVPSLVH